MFWACLRVDSRLLSDILADLTVSTAVDTNSSVLAWASFKIF